MKVCFVTTSFPAYQGDIQSPFIYQLAKHLAKQKIDLRVVCPYYKKSSAKNEVMEGIKVKRFSYFPRFLQTLTEKGRIASFKSNPWSLIQLPCFLKAMIWKTWKEAKDADLIHCQWALSGIAGVIAKKLRKKPLVVSLRGEDLKALHNPIMKPVFRWVINNADYIMSNNEFHINQIKSLKKQVRVIRNGVDTSLFKIRPKQAMRKKLNLPQNKTLVLFVGWLVERKGVQYLIDAIPEVVKKYKDVEFVLIGEGNLREDLVQQAKKNHIENYIRFLGKKSQQQVAEYMNAADVFILPSLYEGMPNVVMEAFASGLSVIATDVCGTSEIVHHKVNGLLIKQKNPEDIVRNMLMLLRNKQLAARYAEAGQETIKKLQLTWEKCAEKHIKLYKEISSEDTEHDKEQRFRIKEEEFKKVIDLDSFMIKIFRYNYNHYSYESLNENQKILYNYSMIIGDLDNGGFFQFLQNNKGKFNKEGLEVFKKIGDKKTYKIFSKAIKIFKRHPRFFIHDEYDTLKEDSKDAKNLSKLDDKYYACSKQREERFIDYVKKHIKDYIIFNK